MNQKSMQQQDDSELFWKMLYYDPVSRHIDLDDDHITENTRCSYPLSFIPNVVPEGYVQNTSKKYNLS